MKKGVKFIFVFALAILLCASFVSAGWFGDMWGKITGHAPEGYVPPGICDDVTSEMKSKYSSFFDASGISSRFKFNSSMDASKKYGFDILNPSINAYYCDVNPDGSVCVGGLHLLGAAEGCLGDTWIEYIVSNPKCYGSSKVPFDEVDLLSPGDSVSGSYSTVCKDVVVGDRAGNLYGFDLSSSPKLDIQILSSTKYRPVSYGEKIYVSSGSSLIAYDSSMNELWRERTTHIRGGLFYQPIVDEEGVLYVGTSAGMILAYDLKKSSSLGEIKWKIYKETSDQKHVFEHLSVDEKYLAFGDVAKGIFIVDKESGEDYWNYSSNQNYIYPELYESKLYLVGVSGTSRGVGVIAFNLNSKTKVWEKFFGVSRFSPMHFDENIIYFGAKGGLVALDKDTGKIIWEKSGTHTVRGDHSPEKYFGTIDGKPVTDENYVYFAGNKGSAFSLNKIDGTNNWQYLIEDKEIVRSNDGNGDYVYVSSPILAEEYVSFVVGKNREVPSLYVLNKEDGTEALAFELGGTTETINFRDSPGVVCERVYDASDDPAPNGKKRNWSRVREILDNLRKKVFPDSQSIDYIEPLDYTGCQTEPGCQEIKGNLVCDRKFCTLYESSVSNGVIDGGLLLPGLGTLRYWGLVNEKPNITIASSIDRDEALTYDVRSSTKDYVFFQVGEPGEFGGTVGGGDDCEKDSDCDGDLVCEDGSCVEREKTGASCKKEGIKTVTKRLVEGKLFSGEVEDSCANETRLNVFYCDDVVLKNKFFDCANGCEEGVCVGEGGIDGDCTKHDQCSAGELCTRKKCVEVKKCTDEEDFVFIEYRDGSNVSLFDECREGKITGFRCSEEDSVLKDYSKSCARNEECGKTTLTKRICVGEGGTDRDCTLDVDCLDLNGLEGNLRCDGDNRIIDTNTTYSCVNSKCEDSSVIEEIEDCVLEFQYCDDSDSNEVKCVDEKKEDEGCSRGRDSALDPYIFGFAEITLKSGEDKILDGCSIISGIHYAKQYDCEEEKNKDYPCKEGDVCGRDNEDNLRCIGKDEGEDGEESNEERSEEKEVNLFCTRLSDGKYDLKEKGRSSKSEDLQHFEIMTDTCDGDVVLQYECDDSGDGKGYFEVRTSCEGEEEVCEEGVCVEERSKSNEGESNGCECENDGDCYGLGETIKRNTQSLICTVDKTGSDKEGWKVVGRVQEGESCMKKDYFPNEAWKEFGDLMCGSPLISVYSNDLYNCCSEKGEFYGLCLGRDENCGENSSGGEGDDTGSCDNGCLFGSECYSLGERFVGYEGEYYCGQDEAGNYMEIEQKNFGEACGKNLECDSEICCESKEEPGEKTCVSLISYCKDYSEEYDCYFDGNEYFLGDRYKKQYCGFNSLGEGDIKSRGQRSNSQLCAADHQCGSNKCCDWRGDSGSDFVCTGKLQRCKN